LQQVNSGAQGWGRLRQLPLELLQLRTFAVQLAQNTNGIGQANENLPREDWLGR
jgi:hypothetical protein